LEPYFFQSKTAREPSAKAGRRRSGGVQDLKRAADEHRLTRMDKTEAVRRHTFFRENPCASVAKNLGDATRAMHNMQVDTSRQF
jgi:hypothetical protein